MQSFALHDGSQRHSHSSMILVCALFCSQSHHFSVTSMFSPLHHDLICTLTRASCPYSAL
ncbi:hypothetical protein BS47DRAFT_193043 [Hydnum rufescens UP504]|uniref:Uncharacterized protein n=1 Tax=Hydnum rufescens UP504 TaxID=1448309 RepID=A0A9P6B7A2_9AGAM|nr:hypothetical protein BS47DRAFT_193043 [Hydnum rufescens UP504]